MDQVENSTGDDKADFASNSGGTIRMNFRPVQASPNHNWNCEYLGSAAYTWVGDFNRDGHSDFASANAAAGVVHMNSQLKTVTVWLSFVTFSDANVGMTENALPLKLNNDIEQPLPARKVQSV